MKKIMTAGLIAGMLVTAFTGIGLSQGKYLTNTGEISFYSHTVIEDITAKNSKVASVLNAATGEVVIIVKMTDFQFKKKLMQEHFNENYVESEKFPKATFNGSITNNADVDYSEPGTYEVRVTGDMTIHGTTQVVTEEGTVEVTGTGITARTTFRLNPEDYKIKIPKVVRKNIAESMEIKVELKCNPI